MKVITLTTPQRRSLFSNRGAASVVGEFFGYRKTDVQQTDHFISPSQADAASE